MTAKIKYILLNIMILGILSLCFGGVLWAAECEKSSKNKIVGSFLEKDITKLEVYYFSWRALTRTAVTEDNLVNDFWDIKVIIKDPNISSINNILREMKFEKPGFCLSDFRLGFIFYSNNEEVLRVFFAQSPSVVAINKQYYKASIKFLQPFLVFLPCQEREDVLSYLKKNDGE